MNQSAGTQANSLAPAALFGRYDTHAHGVLFYGDEEYLIEDITRHVGPAIASGEAAIVVVTGEHRQALEKRLQADGVDLSGAVGEGRFVALDASEMLTRFMVDGTPDRDRFTQVLGDAITLAASTVESEHARVAVFGEMVTLLWAEGQYEAAVELENLWNGLAKEHAFDLRCAYPMNYFESAEDIAHMEHLCAVHSHVLPSESYTSLQDEVERLRAIALLQQKAQALEREIEERKKTEASLQRREAELADFLENALEGVQQVGGDHVIQWANRALLTLLGYSAEEYVGRTLGEFHAHPQIFEEFWRRLMQREDIYDFPAELRCKDGTIKHVVIHSNGLWDGEKFLHTRCFVRDVTEQKRMERALLQSNLELRRAVAVRDEFLSVAAHELKTPITSLRGFAQLLLRETRKSRPFQPERLESALHAVETQTGKLTKLVGRLLDTAQIEAGKLRLELVPTDLVDLVHHILHEHTPESDHTFAFHAPDRLYAMVDPIRFEQVVTNLIDNALKFSPHGGTVTVELEQAAGGEVQLSVTDQGVGILPAQQDTIFDRFHQSHSDGHLSGLGLGLYITREIVEMHGGTIRVVEPEQPGSRFVVTLPLPAGLSSGGSLSHPAGM